ncbi:zf-TFIIB domain-containing protein [Rhodoferax sp.]|uniref:TFIIB-type zinc ribbon-containing protein n=1 Tax=Rhodoferax sp. TaxID=50421 RepID=UPI0026334F5E|nr:zf-TFIIB domain-containing protein [Rhodoferax sp.]MDD2924305.1 zf-TFIIB domain-containing protein [Rhodoferax sp.]
MSDAPNCPSCHAPMEVHALASVAGGKVALDLCFACHGIWFDPQENLKLTAAAVVTLFKLLHEHRDAPRQPLALKLACPHCSRTLAQGFDVVRSGRYITYRCPQRHGRFSAFSSFMIEKGFVRQLTQPEIDDMARRVAVIYCSSCGAPVDLRQDHACPHCRSAFSLLDPQAVERALQGYAKAASGAQAVKVPELADALVALERDRQRAQREAREAGGFTLPGDNSPRLDLWGLGVAMVWSMLN